MRVYLSGAISDVSYAYANQWRAELKENIESLTKGQWKCFNPLDHYNYEITPEYGYTEPEVMNYELGMLRNSDIVICRWDENKSLGTACELAIAYERRIPVLLLVTDDETFIHPWVEAMADHVFKDKDTLIHYLISNYFNEV